MGSKEEIEALRTPKGGWTKEALARFEISWPPPKGWKKRLDGKRTKDKKPKAGKVNKFYSTYEWRKVRYEVLKRDGARCLLCGASRKDGAVLNVDHIKPLKKFWSLRLDPENLQTLCSACNHGKGNLDETDWRTTP